MFVTILEFLESLNALPTDYDGSSPILSKRQMFLFWPNSVPKLLFSLGAPDKAYPSRPNCDIKYICHEQRVTHSMSSTLQVSR